MQKKNLAAAVITVLSACLAAAAQGTVVINDPTVNDPNAINDNKYKLLPGEQRALDTLVLPKVRKKLGADACDEEVVISGKHQGFFTQAKLSEDVIFYQYCQTGNGLGKAGVAIFQGERLVASFFADEAGWPNDSAVLPDINKNGLDEIALYYSGGMHQGEGGTGVDIVEYSRGALKGIGWYQSDGFAATGPSWAWKVTVNPGNVPVFFKEKYLSTPSGKWRKSGKAVPLKLTAIVAPYTAI
jgi:hypothetical protein